MAGNAYSKASDVQLLCPVFYWTVCLLFDVELYEFLINFGYLPHIRCIIGKYDLSFHGLSFHFVDGFLAVQKLFSVMWSFLFMFLLFPFPEEVYQKKYC